MPTGTLVVNEKGALNEIGYTATATTTAVFTTSYMVLLTFVRKKCLCSYIFRYIKVREIYFSFTLKYGKLYIKIFFKHSYLQPFHI